MTRSLALAPSLLIASALLLAGCAGPIDTTGAVSVDDDAPTTINAADLAIVAEDVIAGQGFTVDVDCGTEEVPFVEGTSLECTAFDEVSETSGAYTVTIRSIVGAEYELQVIGSESEPTPQPDAVFESIDAFNQLTAEAIAGTLGETPVVDCGTFDIEVFVGNEIRCGYTASSASGTVISTITSFDGSFYEISVVEE
jgi:hypothetical protein